MSNHEVKIIVISSLVSLGQIEEILGASLVGGHSRGSARENGLVRKQSMWLRVFSSGSELLEDVVDEALDWLAARCETLRNLDPEVFCKMCCKLGASDGQDGFVVNTRMARKLVDSGVLLLLDKFEDEDAQGNDPVK